MIKEIELNNTVNLQRGLTVKQAAKLMGVSERDVYKARKVTLLRPDLADEISEGGLAGCSCSMCGNPRNWWNEKTMQERKNSA